MNTETIKANANWKVRFEIFWNNTPKKKRRTISQINHIKSQAKLYTTLWN